MGKTIYPPYMQKMIDRLNKAKRAASEINALEKSLPANPYELTTTYSINKVENKVVLELVAKSDLTAWKESEKFLKELYTDDDYTLISAEIKERDKPKYITNDYFFIWRQQ